MLFAFNAGKLPPPTAKGRKPGNMLCNCCKSKLRILTTFFANRDNLLACNLSVLRHFTRAATIIGCNFELSVDLRHNFLVCRKRAFPGRRITSIGSLPGNARLHGMGCAKRELHNGAGLIACRFEVWPS